MLYYLPPKTSGGNHGKHSRADRPRFDRHFRHQAAAGCTSLTIKIALPAGSIAVGGV